MNKDLALLLVQRAADMFEAATKTGTMPVEDIDALLHECVHEYVEALADQAPPEDSWMKGYLLLVASTALYLLRELPVTDDDVKARLAQVEYTIRGFEVFGVEKLPRRTVH